MKNLYLLISALIIASVASAQIPTDSLVGYWPFNGNANDESGNGNNGTLNTVNLTTDRFGQLNKAYEFLGTSTSFIEIPHHLDFNSSNFTFSYWLYRIGTSEPSIPISKGRDVIDGFIYIFQNGEGVFHVESNDMFGTNATDLGSQHIQLNTWHHMALVVDNTNSRMKLFIDRILIDDQALNGPHTPTNIHPLVLGRHFVLPNGGGGAEYPFEGKLDDGRFYIRSLAECEIVELFFEGQDHNILVPQNTICSGESATLNVYATIIGQSYQLVDTASGNFVGTALMGNDDTVSLSTGPLTSSGGFKVSIRDTATGCTRYLDSIINITLNSVDVTVTQNAVDLMSNASNGTYQWLDCNNNKAAIGGEVNQTFTATANGSYAVEVTQNSCVDTSACFDITTVVVLGRIFEDEFIIYPNPTNGTISIKPGNVKIDRIIIFNMLGKAVFDQSFQTTIYLNQLVQGVYIIKLYNKNGKIVEVGRIINPG